MQQTSDLLPLPHNRCLHNDASRSKSSYTLVPRPFLVYDVYVCRSSFSIYGHFGTSGICDYFAEIYSLILEKNPVNVT